MLYERYLKRIFIVARILNTIRRFRVLISVVAAVAVVSTGTFMAVQGVVYDNVACPTEIQYGDALPFEANAVFGDIRYEYASQAAPDNWLDQAPTLPGTYYVRAVSTSTFGTPRYGESHAYTIIPRSINVAVEQTELAYGDEPSVSAPLVYGDSISCDKYIYEDLSLEQTKVSASKDSIVIKDISGNDVTSYYNISVVQSELLFIPRQITVTVSSASAIYNGLPLSFDGFELTEGTLAYSDQIYPVINTSITDAGQIENKAESWIVINSDNVNVTQHYEIIQITGVLSVDKRPLVIETGGNSSVYDGTEKQHTDFTVLEGGENQGLALVEGHTAIVKSATSIINVGSKQNLLTFGILDANGNEVTDNYSIFLSQPKMIEVTKRPVTLTTGSYQGDYDDKYHKNDSYVLSQMGIADGQSAIYSQAPTIIDVGEKTNAVTLNVVDKDGQDVTSNYEISYVYGVLKVEPIVLDVSTLGGEKTYDGRELVMRGYNITNEDTALITGHHHQYASSTSITNVCTDGNGNVSDEVNKVTLTITNSEGRDVSHNYVLNYGENDENAGRLKIVPKEITIKTHSKTFTYDGSAHSFLEFSTEGEEDKGFRIVEGELIEGQTIRAVADKSASVQHASEGEIANVLEFEFVDSEGNIVPKENYIIHCPDENVGVIKVTPLELTVTTNSKTFVYDGLSHRFAEEGEGFAITDGILPDGHALYVISATEVTDHTPNGVANEIKVGIKLGEETVADTDYVIHYQYSGELTVTKRPITLVAGSATKIYDGTALRYDSWSIADEADDESDALAPDQQISLITVAGEQIEFGEAANKITQLQISDKNGVDVTGNYEIVLVDGALKVEKRTITVTTATNSWVYDGQEHYDIEFVIADDESDDNDALAAGQIAHANDDYLKFTDVNETANANANNVFSITVTNADGVDVSTNYEIAYEFGTLTVLPRPVSIITESGEWTYDGDAHSAVDYKYAPESLELVGEHRIVFASDAITYAVNYTAEPIDNVLVVEKIVDENGADVSTNYVIPTNENGALTYGTLTVNKRPVLVVTNGNEWTYDGMSHSESGFNIANDADGYYALVAEHEAVALTQTVKFVENVWDTGEGGIDNVFAVVIKNNGEDITYNYDIAYRYGKLIIKPRPITVTTATNSWVYDGEAHSDEGFVITDGYDGTWSYLALGQTAQVIEGTLRSVTNVWDNATENNIFKIELLDSDRSDMTANYEITYVFGTIEITPRPISIVTATNSWIYDGKDHCDESYSYADGSLELVGDHRIVFDSEYTATVKYYSVNKTDNKLVVARIVSGSGDGAIDVSQNYIIPTEDNGGIALGKIWIEKRSITIRTSSSEWVYDGAEHSNAGYSIVEGELAEGDRIEVDTSDAIITDAGTRDNALLIDIYCGELDVGFNYNVTVTFGELKVIPRKVQIKTGDGLWIYDGTDHYNISYEVIEGDGENTFDLVIGHKLQLTSYTTVQNVTDGTPNRLEFKVVTELGEVNKTGNYEFVFDHGTLVVNKRAITVQTATNEWVYNGMPHLDDGFTVENDLGDPNDYLAANQHATVIADSVTYITNVWESAPENNVFKIQIWDARGNETTENYDIVYKYGTLTITPRPITVTTYSNSWIYDGDKHSDTGFSIADGYDGTWHYLALGQIVNVESGTVTYITNTWESGQQNNKFEITFWSSDGKENKTSNYTITYVYGDLEIKQRNITVSTLDGSWVYDGTSHSNAGLNAYNGGYTVGGDGISPFMYAKTVSSTSITNVFDGVVDNVISIKLYLDPEFTREIDTRNYNISYTTPYGKLTVTKRQIILNTLDGTWTYDGLWHGNAGLNVYNGGYTLDHHGLSSYLYSKIVRDTKVKNVDDTPALNDIEIALYLDPECTEANKVDTRNYEIIIRERGTLTILRRDITITAASGTKIYDDQPYVNKNYNVSNLVSFHSIGYISIVSDELIDVGEVANVPSGAIILDENAEDVTRNYNITYVNGTLKIDPRPFAIVTDTGSWIYDAQAHSLPAYSYSANSPYQIVDGHTVVFKQPYPSITNYVEGGIPNALEIDMIISSTGRDVTHNYVLPNIAEGTLEYGRLIIIRRSISIVTGSEEWIYDGTYKTNDEFEVVQPADPRFSGLVDGQRVTVDRNTLCYIQNVGEIYNELKVFIMSGDVDVTYNYEIRYTLGVLEVKQRPILIQTGSLEEIYDAEEHSNSEIVIVTTADGYYPLVNGHNAVVDQYKIVVNVWESGANELTVRIMNGNEDVTDNYSIDFLHGILNIIPRPLTITSGTSSKDYDGKPLTDNSFKAEGLVEGHRVADVEITGSQTLVGTSPNSIANATIMDNNYSDVTANYDISYVEGTLTVKGIDIVIKFDDGEFVYDGEFHSMPSASGIDGYKLREGDKIVPVDPSSVPAIRDVGTAPNFFDFIIVNSNGEDVTLCYNVIGEIPGILVVVSGEDDDEEEDDDGGGSGGGGGGSTELDMSGNLGGSGAGNPDGEPIVVMKVKSDVSGSVYMRLMSFGEYTGQGWAEAPAYLELLDGMYSYNFLTGAALGMNGYVMSTLEVESFSSQYFLPYYLAMDSGILAPMPDNDAVFGNSHDGKYTITYYLYTGDGSDLAKVLGLYTEAERRYAEFVYNNYLEVDSVTRAYLEGIIAAQGFDKNDPDIVSKVATYVQNAAKYNLAYNPDMDKEENAVIAFLDKYKEGVCRHYASAATLIFRALGIPARYTTGFVGGTAAGEWTEITSDKGHAWTEVYIDGVGWIMVEVTGGGFGGGGNGGGGGGGNNDDEQEPIKPQLPITPQTVYKSYDGTPLYAENKLDENTLELRDLLAQGYRYEVVVEGSQTQVGEGISKITSFILYDPDNNDVTDQYEVIFNEGKIKVMAAQNKITAYVWEVNKVYDGTPISYRSNYCTIQSVTSSDPNISLEGYTYSLEIQGSRTDVGILSLDEIEYVLKVYDADGRDVTINFYVEFVGVPLTVNKRAITLMSASEEKPYDEDKPLTNETVTVSKGSLVEGHTLHAKASGQLDYKGEIDNEIDPFDVVILDSQGNDVTGNYDISYVFGTLKYN